jgi:hypothetical protein
MPLIHHNHTILKRKKNRPGLSSQRIKDALELTKYGKSSDFGRVQSDLECNFERTSSLFGRVPRLLEPSVVSPAKVD